MNGNGFVRWALGLLLLPALLTAVAWGVNDTKIVNLEREMADHEARINTHDENLIEINKNLAVIQERTADIKELLKKPK